MKTGLTIFFGFTFLALAVFSFWAIAGAGTSYYTGCLASLVQGQTCPESPGSLGFVKFHIEAAQVFSTAFIKVLGWSLFFIGLGLFVFILVQNESNDKLTSPAGFRFYHRVVSQLALLPLISYLAFHQNSPNLS